MPSGRPDGIRPRRREARRPPTVRSGAVEPGSGERSADAVATLDRVTQSRSLVGGHLDDETPAALKGHPQHDAATLLDDLERAIAGPRLHCCHGSPSLGILGLWPHYPVSRLRDLIGM